MRTKFFENGIQLIQNGMYEGLNDFSEKNAVTRAFGCLGAIPVTVIDLVLEVVIKQPLNIIENLALAILNFFGAAYSEKYSLQDAKTCLTTALITPLTVAKVGCWASMRLLFNILNPASASSVSFNRATPFSPLTVWYPTPSLLTSFHKTT